MIFPGGKKASQRQAPSADKRRPVPGSSFYDSARRPNLTDNAMAAKQSDTSAGSGDLANCSCMQAAAYRILECLVALSTFLIGLAQALSQGSTLARQQPRNSRRGGMSSGTYQSLLHRAQSPIVLHSGPSLATGSLCYRTDAQGATTQSNTCMAGTSSVFQACYPTAKN